MFKKLTGLFAVMAAGLFWAGMASAGTISGSPHDFRAGGISTGWATTTEICVVCHAPHDNPMGDGSETLLWNRNYATTSAYVTYANATMVANPGQPSGVSKLCLSCHDGTVAVDQFGGETEGVNFLTSSDAAYVGTDLSNDHPISFDYPTTNASSGDPELYVKTTAMPAAWGGSGTPSIDEAMLIDGKVECASCHDVHNTNAVATTYLLLVSNTNSALCLTCHNK
jgi:predicted CXXCH cytochrome family protein